MLRVNNSVQCTCTVLDMLISVINTIERKIKGVTHCYLPDCDRLTWPFENYCSRKDADLGKRMGLPHKSCARASIGCGS